MLTCVAPCLSATLGRIFASRSYVEGDRFRVGSNQPQDLAAAIPEAIGASWRS